MLNVIRDGPFRYLHSAATGELILTLATIGSRYFDFDKTEPGIHTMREWKAIARKRMGDCLITDTDNRN